MIETCLIRWRITFTDSLFNTPALRLASWLFVCPHNPRETWQVSQLFVALTYQSLFVASYRRILIDLVRKSTRYNFIRHNCEALKGSDVIHISRCPVRHSVWLRSPKWELREDPLLLLEPTCWGSNYLTNLERPRILLCTCPEVVDKINILRQ